MPLSVAIVCKNNARTIGRTLESVRGLADETVAVDSGSTDGTLELLEKHGARIIRSAWLGHVRTKQLALESCTGDWVLSLDSDESLDPVLRARIAETLPGGPGAGNGWALRRKVFYRGSPLNYAWQPEWRVRLVRRGRAEWRGLDPHDELVLLGPRDRAARIDAGFIRHDSVPTWAEFFAKQAQHARTMAQSMHSAGKRGSVLRLATSPPGAFLKQIVLKRAWRDGWPGWVAAASTAAGSLMKHAALLELSRAPGAEPAPGAHPGPGTP